MMRILIVDDHAMVREGLKRILLDEFQDALFGEASNAGEALDQVWKKTWELVLLDVSMHFDGTVVTLHPNRTFSPSPRPPRARADSLSSMHTEVGK